MIFGHSIGVYSTNTKPDGSKGIGTANATGIGDIPDSNFMVSLGSESGQVGKPLEQAGTFMHELGHNLGLRHGGTDNVNNKPNYLSVMNYSFQFGLITNGVRNAVDYSNFYQIPSLNEYSLNEQVGLNGGPLVANYGTFYYCYVEVPAKGGGLTLQQQTRFVPYANPPIDWNCNGTIDAGTLKDGYDLDGLTDQFSDPALTTDPLVGSEDWSHLIFAGGAIGQLGQGSGGSLLGEQAVEGPVPHLPVPNDVDVVSPGLAIVPPGASITNFTYTITNTGQQPDTYNLTPVSQYSNWWDISGVPATISLRGRSSTGHDPGNSSIELWVLESRRRSRDVSAASDESVLSHHIGKRCRRARFSDVSRNVVRTFCYRPDTERSASSDSRLRVCYRNCYHDSSSWFCRHGSLSQIPSGCGFVAPGRHSLVASTGPAFVATQCWETQAAASAAIASGSLDSSRRQPRHGRGNGVSESRGSFQRFAGIVGGNFAFSGGSISISCPTSLVKPWVRQTVRLSAQG
jgi:hypothetical protein